MNKFLCIVVMEMGMIMAMGILAIRKGAARNLYKKPDGTHHAHNSLFGCGLMYFVKRIAQRKRLPKPRFYLDIGWQLVPVVP